MIIGKMFPVLCYKDEADWQTRFALSLGMCPRGEVGAGIIVISIESGITGPAIELAVVCLAINLILSGAFVTWTRQLAHASEARIQAAAIERRLRRERKKAKKRKKKRKLDEKQGTTDDKIEEVKMMESEDYPYNLDPHSPSQIKISTFDDEAQRSAAAI
jgi:hypothetical protein